MALYNLKEGLLKTLLTLAYYPLGIILATNGVSAYFGQGLTTLTGYIGVAIFLAAAWDMLVRVLPEAKNKQKLRMIGGGRRWSDQKNAKV